MLISDLCKMYKYNVSVFGVSIRNNDITDIFRKKFQRKPNVYKGYKSLEITNL